MGEDPQLPLIAITIDICGKAISMSSEIFFHCKKGQVSRPSDHSLLQC